MLLLIRVGPFGPLRIGRFSEEGACSLSDGMADRSLFLGVRPILLLPRSEASDSEMERIGSHFNRVKECMIQDVRIKQ